MKPVAIVQQIHHDTPDYFTDFLDSENIPWQLFRMDQGDVLPTTIANFSGYCMLGGPMSVNDEAIYPWLSTEMQLVKEAYELDIPMIGHCLGGQLIAKGLGATVAPVPMPEIGWCQIQIHDEKEASEWFGGENPAKLFQWHGEGFQLPAGARLIASSAHWQNQAFLINNKHLGMQFHCEVKEDKVKHWSIEERAEIESVQHHASVQSADEILASLAKSIPESNRIAHRIYSRWIQGLIRA